MAWTAPMTAIANTKFTAAEFNLYVRDNLNYLKTEADGNPHSLATAANAVFVTTGPNALAERFPDYDYVAASEDAVNTGSTWSNLSTPGPAVTVTTGTTALVWCAAEAGVGTNDLSCQISLQVSGATTIAPGGESRVVWDGHPSGNLNSASGIWMPTLNPGVNTFTMKYLSGVSHTATFRDRKLMVIPL